MSNGTSQDITAVLDREIQRTKPDYIVYRPGSVDGSTFDTGNEEFLVFDGPDGSLMAVWTQSSYEGAGDHRIVFARSADEGRTWSDPTDPFVPPLIDGRPGYRACFFLSRTCTGSKGHSESTSFQTERQRHEGIPWVFLRFSDFLYSSTLST